jgi:hypothetical protein
MNLAPIELDRSRVIFDGPRHAFEAVPRRVELGVVAVTALVKTVETDWLEFHDVTL